MTLRRLITRCGKTNEIISDNSAQFKLSKSTIDTVWEKRQKRQKVPSYIAGRGIKLKLNIELSTLTGGFYGRIFACGKMALRKSIGKKYLTQLQLPTFLSETKAVLNSRPLVYVGHDLNDRKTITLYHFLTLNNKTRTPIVEED